MFDFCQIGLNCLGETSLNQLCDKYLIIFLHFSAGLNQFLTVSAAQTGFIVSPGRNNNPDQRCGQHKISSNNNEKNNSNNSEN